MKRPALTALAVSALLAATPLATPLVHAQEAPGVVTIEGTRIRGDQEVPTVMYLVPWQPPGVDELRAPEERLMVEQALKPLERYEFRRFIQYHEAFIEQTQAANGQ